MARYLYPTTNITMFKVFGKNPDLTISFLNALLPLDNGNNIIEVEYIKQTEALDNQLLENNVVDVKCTGADGSQFYAEIQTRWSDEFELKIETNDNKTTVRTFGSKKHYPVLPLPFYSLNLLDLIVDKKSENFYHYCDSVYDFDTNQLIENLKLIYIELPKFKSGKIDKAPMFDIWLRYLTEIDEKTKYPSKELSTNPFIQKALDIIEEWKFSEGEMYAYEKFWDSVSVERSVFRTAYNEGYNEGLALGMKERGCPFDEIQKATGLSEEEINKL